MTRVRGPRRSISSAPPAAATVPPAIARWLRTARPPRPSVRTMPPAKMRSALTRRLKEGNGRIEALRRRAVLRGREPVDQHSVGGRALAVEWIRLGAGERNDRAGICAIPPISTSKPAPADAVDQTDAVRSRGLVRGIGPVRAEPPVLDVWNHVADDQPIDSDIDRPESRGIAAPGGLRFDHDPHAVGAPLHRR